MDWLRAQWERYSHPTDDERELREQFGRLLESLNRLLFFVALMVFYFLLVPILCKVETATTKTATQLESIEKRLTATEQAVFDRLKDPEL